MTESFEVSSFGFKIKGILTTPRDDKRYPCVILSHGLISSKESSKYLALSERLVLDGIATCRFDYHGCGESEGNIEETTLTIRVGNLDSIFEYVFKHKLIDPEKIGILGSSFGGSTCIVKASKDKRVKCISLWATPFLLEKKDGGRISEIDFNETIYDDFLKYDLLSEAKKITCALVIHGEDDEVVPLYEGKAIYKNIKKPKKLYIIKGGDHIFSVVSHREKVIELATNWFRHHLTV
ncbi:MAG: hypothetical protein ILNGONEN_02175 [Syntrophorhabdaceae bacterium]|nr:hypothetical protein [Syntrophorhabdaceae bacterium]HNQ62968.1 alpha/beta hydrolase [Syntrophorhabdaceae bacterium]HNZ59488.1 alpha/beta hydrolase [Syntrophorhabdaceae bacterium]HOG40591.1 alpha/beta hydrolase [Syntrophorhabdaceae bacterium]